MPRILALCTLAITMLFGATLVAGHGYVSEPPSRQYRCRLGEIQNCGDVQYQPQSVEAPKGSYLCNGGSDKWLPLNDDSLFASTYYTVAVGIEQLDFTWTLTAPHRTTTFEYIVITEDNKLLSVVDLHNTTPADAFSHTVPLGGITGRQTVLARWNIGDTQYAFYSCVDLDILSEPTKTAVAGAAATAVPVQLPVSIPGPDEVLVANDTYSSISEGLTAALPYLYVVPGASV